MNFPPSRSLSFRFAIKLVVLAIVVAIAATSFFAFGDLLSLESLARREAELRQFQRDQPILVYGIAFVIYVAVTAMSLPGAAVLTLVFGWYFGSWRAFVVVSFASTIGATLAFLLSRYLYRDWVQIRFSDQLQKFNQSLEREGAFYLFTLRLIVGVPFFLINIVMGLTPIHARTFYWVSQIGMLPGTAAYVYAGSSVPDLKRLSQHGASGILSIEMVIAFLVLGLLPIATKRIIAVFKPNP